MPNQDPYHPTPAFEYECVACGVRLRAESSPGACPACGGLMLDVSVTRE